MIEMKIEIRDPEEMRATADYLLAMAKAFEQARERRIAEFGQQAVIKRAVMADAPRSQLECPQEPAVEAEQAPPEAAEQPTKKRRRKTVAEQTEAEPEQVEAAPEVVEAAPATKITLEDVRAKTAQLSQAGHGNAIREILKKYGATNLTSLPADMYDLFMGEVEAIDG